MMATLHDAAADIASRAVPLSARQIRQHADRHGLDGTELLSAVRRLRRQPVVGQALEDQRRRSAEGVRLSRLRQRREQRSADRFAAEVESIHAAMIAAGWSLDKISESGSRYYHRGTELARVSDHAGNEATQAWVDRLGVREISSLDQVE